MSRDWDALTQRRGTLYTQLLTCFLVDFDFAFVPKYFVRFVALKFNILMPVVHLYARLVLHFRGVVVVDTVPCLMVSRLCCTCFFLVLQRIHAVVSSKSSRTSSRSCPSLYVLLLYLVRTVSTKRDTMKDKIV